MVSEHIFMGFRAGVRFALSKMGSEQIRRERAERYAKRKQILDQLEAAAEKQSTLGVAEIQRRKSVRINAADLFWTRQADDGASEDAGLHIIKTAKWAQEEKNVTGRDSKIE
jgi:anoctamin-10